jgi:hypothetical protein
MKMKLYLVILFTFLGTILFTGCNLNLAINGKDGSGNIIRHTQQMPSFNAVVLEISGNVYITQGNEESVTVETDDNIMSYLETKIINGTLHISSSRNIDPTRLNIWVKMKNVNGLTIEGSGNIYADSPISTNDIALDIEGSGDIDIKNLTSQNVMSVISGSGDMNVAGTNNALDMRIDGSGDMNCLNLLSNFVSVQVNGSGDCKFSVTTSLNAEINGSGDVLYKGSPKDLKTQVNGSGSIKKIG